MKIILPVALCILAALAQSCRQIPNEGIPFYMKMDSAVLNTNLSSEGPNTHGISDVWVEANANNLGAFEMPINFPVLMENEVRFVVNAGIKESGQTNVRVIYPFYLPDTFTLTAERGKFYDHTPTFRYKSGITLSFIEDFESGNSFNGVQKIDSDTNILYGDYCGKISVSALDSSEMGTLIQPVVLTPGQDVWLEADYKAEVPFYIGVYANYTGGAPGIAPVLFVTQKEGWHKVYVNLTNLVGYAGANSYTPYFEALRPFGTNGGSIYLDNIKLIHN